MSARAPARPRAALYLRVSTDGQSVENQRPALVKIARARGWTIVRDYSESASAKGPRPAFAAMLQAAHAGEFSVLLVWSLDRFGRSMAGNLADVLALDSYGVAVVSSREEWLASTGPMRTLMLAIFSWVAEQEREQLIARTRAGLDRARARGIRLGRPPRRIEPPELARAVERVESGESTRSVAKSIGVPATTFTRALAAAKAAPEDPPRARRAERAGSDRRRPRSS